MGNSHIAKIMQSTTSNSLNKRVPYHTKCVAVSVNLYASVVSLLVNVVFSDAEPIGDSDRARQHWHIATGCTVTSLCRGYVNILRDQQDGFDYEFMH